MVKRKTLLIIILLPLLIVTLTAIYYPVMAITYGQGDYGYCPYSSSSTSCDISISNNGFTLFLNVTPSAGGSCTIQNDQVTVSTYDPNGYTLTLANEATNTAMLANDGSSNSVPASSGTPASPIPLLDSWGYRVDNWSNFGAGPTTAAINSPSNSSITFAGTQPSNGTADVIAQTSTLNSTVTSTVWYGICLDNNLNITSGSYSSTVEYTATAN